MIGTRLTHYLVLERLGSGGMGVVFRARDERLQREVALKVLPEGALADPANRRRFLNEAVAASRVSHPGIGVVHEFATHGTTDFLVMELVPGEPLEDRLARGLMPEAEVVGLGLQIADALSALHALGLVHLDLKPANVIVTPEGRAKLVDFGLSRWAEGLSDPGTGMTSGAGVRALAGTLAYMAPERFVSGAADPRSDLWSLGVLLYRAACGRLPFQVSDVAALTYDVLNRAPAPPRSLVPELSAGFESVLLRALSRPLEERFATAAQLGAALRDRAAGAAAVRPPRITSLAVLPLQNLSNDSEQEFFADGMTDAIIAELSANEDVCVISRTSAMRYKGSPLSLPAIGRELGVQAVVEGSVQRVAGEVRVTARLVEAGADRSLWTGSYERSLADVFALQAEVAGAIAGEIRARLSGASRRETRTARAAVAPEVYELYLRGRHHWNRRTVSDLQQARRFFDDAISRAPAFALAHAGLADTYNMLADLTAVGEDTARNAARAAASRALDLDPDLPEALTSLAFVQFFFDWDWAAAEQSFRRAIASGPGWATAHQWFAELLVSSARFVEAEEHARRALVLDPLSFVLHTTLADVLYFSRRFEDAIAALRGTLELAPEHGPSHMDLGRVLSQVGRHDEALASFRSARELMPRGGRSMGGLAHALARAGRGEEARAMLPMLEAEVPSGNVTCHGIAVVLLELGEPEAALDWLERGASRHDRGLVWMRVHPRLDALRGHPRFQALLERLRLV